MLTVEEIHPILFKYVAEVNNFLNLPSSVNAHLYIHGSSGAQKNYQKTKKYATDVDCELVIAHNPKNKKEEFAKILLVNDYFLKNGMQLIKLRGGEDPRYNLQFEIKKDGIPINYNEKKVKTTLNKLLTKEELANVRIPPMKKNESGPTLIEAEQLLIDIEKYQQIYWSNEEIVVGEKMHRGKMFNLYKDCFLQSPFVFAYLWEYSKGEYILFDVTVKPLIMRDEGQNRIKFIESFEFYEGIHKTGLFVDDFGGLKTNIRLYQGIFKNYADKKYLKVLKRLKTLLTTFLFTHRNVNDQYDDSDYELKSEEYRNLFVTIRKQISAITSDNKYACISQIKNRCDIIMWKLMNESGKVGGGVGGGGGEGGISLEIKKLVVDLLNDSLNICMYNGKENITNIFNELGKEKINVEGLINSIALYKEEMFTEMNNSVLPILKEIWAKIGPIMTFKMEL